MVAWIPGNPKTKGSMTARPNGSMRENVAGSSRWRALMRDALVKAVAEQDAVRIGDKSAGVRVDSTWYLARPPTSAGEPPAPTEGHQGDLDKLVRNLLDAGTDAGLWRDDEQVTDFGLTAKRWATPERGPGVRVVVYELDESDLL